MKTSGQSPIRARLRIISAEIGRAHLAGNHELHARLCVEKALYLELLQPSGGTGELLAQCQKEAARALERVGKQREALKFYKKALESRAKIIKYLVGKESTIRGQCEDIARLKGILASNPGETTRVRIESELRSQKLLLPYETLRYEVNVEEVEKLIALLEQQKKTLSVNRRSPSPS